MFKTTKSKILTAVILAAVLAAAFWYGGGAPGLQGWSVGGGRTSASDVQEAGADAALSSDASDDPSVSGISGAGQEGQEGAVENPATGTGQASEDGTAPSAQDAQQESEAPASESPAANSGAQPASGLESRPGGAEGGMSADEKIAAAAALAGGQGMTAAPDAEYSKAQGMEIDPSTGKDKYLTDPVPAGKPVPVNPEDVTVSDTARSCTLSISCASILDRMDWLDPEKHELVPEDGWILRPVQATFYEGESVFNLLQRVCKQNGIHMEFENTPMYHSAYIEGIHNLYEFDCGELSGWMYKVNEWFPNYGCSRYALKEGDVVCWVYTCDLGVDVGGFYSVGD